MYITSIYPYIYNMYDILYMYVYAYSFLIFIHVRRLSSVDALENNYSHIFIVLFFRPLISYEIAVIFLIYSISAHSFLLKHKK